MIRKSFEIIVFVLFINCIAISSYGGGGFFDTPPLPHGILGSGTSEYYLDRARNGWYHNKSEVDINSDGTIDMVGYNFYNSNNLICEQQVDQNNDGTIDSSIELIYNSNGKISQEIENDNDSINGEIFYYNYNSSGMINTMTEKDSAGTIITVQTFSYNSNGLLGQVETKWDNGDIVIYTYTYNSNYQLNKYENPYWNFHYSYDSQGQLSKSEYDQGSDGNIDRTSHYVFASNGNLEKEEIEYATKSGYDTIYFTWANTPKYKGTTPTPPTLSINITEMMLALSWSSVPGATGYTLFYAPYPYTGPETISNIDMGTQTGISANLWAGAAFYVAVQAYNSYGGSDYSNIEHFVIDSSFQINPSSLSLSADETGSSAITGGTAPYTASSSNTEVALAEVSGSTVFTGWKRDGDGTGQQGAFCRDIGDGFGIVRHLHQQPRYDLHPSAGGDLYHGIAIR